MSLMNSNSKLLNYVKYVNRIYIAVKIRGKSVVQYGTTLLSIVTSPFQSGGARICLVDSAVHALL